MEAQRWSFSKLAKKSSEDTKELRSPPRWSFCVLTRHCCSCSKAGEPASWAPRVCPAWGWGQGQKSTWLAEEGRPILGKGPAAAAFLLGRTLGGPKSCGGAEAPTPTLPKEAWLADGVSTCHYLEEQKWNM